MMTQLDPSFQAELKAMARRGVGASELLSAIRRHAGVEGRGEGRFIVALYLKQTFNVPVEKLANAAAWSGFGDSEGGTSDREVDTLLKRYLLPGADEESP
ncbi:MAG: hypothetical protein NXI35_35605 [bacterium]|nr:hypothetical protein [bacterium]